MEDLALQVGQIDDVEVDDADGADAGGGEVERHRRAEAAGADAQHPRRLQLALPFEADLGEDQVPAVALVFLADRAGSSRSVSVALGAPPATDGMMLSASLVCIGVSSFCR